MIVVYMRHIRAMKMCSRGTRAWAQRYGIDYTKFLQEGIAVEKLEATGDAFALEACRIARAEHAAQHDGVNDGKE